MNFEGEYQFKLEIHKRRIENYNDLIKQVKKDRKILTVINVVFFIFLIIAYETLKIDLSILTVISVSVWVASTFDYYSNSFKNLQAYNDKVLIEQVEMENLKATQGERYGL